MRDEVLTNWVSQPPADPVYQYLRDAEKEASWRVLGSRRRVLDVASEANVTMGLDAEEVYRVDFSASSIDHAREKLGDRVERYVQTEPEAPELPFPEDFFDGGVCVGPYDWRFLDVEALTAEVRRVTAPDGRFVFTVPTPRSPYETGGKYRLRYYTPEETRALLEPAWELDDYELVYQHPYWLHSKLALAPPAVQRPFVRWAEEYNETLNERDDWDDASYLVVGARPLDYGGHLESALDCLFRPAEEDGFWTEDGEGGHIGRELRYSLADDGSVAEWTPGDDVVWRYAPFAVMGAMQWRVSAQGTEEYDARLERELAYFAERVEEGTHREMPSYGLGPLVCAFSLAADVFGDDHLDTARDLFEYTDDPDRFAFDHSEDSLLLYGWSYLYERDPTPDLRSAIDRAMYDVVEHQNAWKTLFSFDNTTTRRHQNQMYTLWGLCRGIEVTDRQGYLENVEDVLDYTIEERMLDDGAFIWEDPSRRTYAGAELRRRLGSDDGTPPHWEFLYECHQTFFVNAVSHYYDAGGERDYDAELGRAMRWMDGENVLGEDLVDLSGIGVPMRFVTTGGRMDVPDQMYKGAYEVGSYVMALTNLLGDARARRVEPAREASPGTEPR